MHRKFCLWGTGYRAEKILNIIGKDHIEFFIDNDGEKIGREFKGLKVISLNQYIYNNQHPSIIVTPIYAEDEIIKQLLENNIYDFFLLSLTPSELQSYGIPNYLEHAVRHLALNRRNVIYGDNFYSYLLFEEGVNRLGEGNVVLCCDGLQYERALKICSEKMDFELISHSEINAQDNVLLATPENAIISELNNVNNYTDVFDLSREIEEYQNEKIKKLKNEYENQSCFIVATGPSLELKDLKRIKDNKIYSFGVNRVFQIDNAIWKPDCYVFFDKKGIEDYANEIENYSVEKKILLDNTKELFNNENSSDYFIHVAALHHYDVFPKFSEKIDQVVYGHATVVYAVIQIAIYMGFKTIYLLGTDCNYQKGSCNNYFFRTNAPDYLNHDVQRMFMGYEAAKEYADSHGIKIYNTTRGGMLEVFERVDFDSLFE